MKCNNCEYINIEESNYCQNCGKKIISNSVTNSDKLENAHNYATNLNKLDDVIFKPPSKRKTYESLIKSFFVLLIICLLVVVGIGILSYLKQENEKTTNVPSNAYSNLQDSPEQVNYTQVVLSILRALNYYNMSLNSINNFDDISSIITDLMNAQKYMKLGDNNLLFYENSSNEYISVTVKGTLIGSEKVQRSLENLIQYLRTLDETNSSSYKDINYQVAKFKSDRDEGFKLIAMSAPQITSILYDPADSKNPTGVIQYNISKEERLKILSEIDSLFGSELKDYYKNDTLNWIIFAVNQINKQLLYDTYEQYDEDSSKKVPIINDEEGTNSNKIKNKTDLTDNLITDINLAGTFCTNPVETIDFISVEAIGFGKVKLTWTPNLKTTSSHSIFYSTSTAGFSLLTSSGSGVQEVGGLTPNQKYYFLIQSDWFVGPNSTCSSSNARSVVVK